MASVLVYYNEQLRADYIRHQVCQDVSVIQLEKIIDSVLYRNKTHNIPKQKLDIIENFIAFLKQKALAKDMSWPLVRGVEGLNIRAHL
jgi:hypothetical protein